MHEITIPPSVTTILFKLTASCLSKISNRRKISNYWATRIEPPLQGPESGSCLVLLLKLSVNISNHVISKVITYVEGLKLSKLTELLKNILVEILKVFLYLDRVNSLALGVQAWSDTVRSLIHVGEEESGGYSGAVMEPGTPVPMAACPNLKIKRAIHTVLLCTKY